MRKVHSEKYKTEYQRTGKKRRLSGHGRQPGTNYELSTSQPFYDIMLSGRSLIFNIVLRRTGLVLHKQVLGLTSQNKV